MSVEKRIIPRRIYYKNEQKLEILKHYADEHDDSIADIRYNEIYIYDSVEYPVGDWIDTFRKSNKPKYTEDYKWNPLPQDVVDKLDALNMLWQRRIEYCFADKIKVLKAYIADPNILYDNIAYIEALETYELDGVVYPIGSWIRHWRRAYHGDKYHVALTQEEIDILNELGMDWDPIYNRFEDKITILKAYIADPEIEATDISKISVREVYVYNGVEYHIGSWIYSWRRCKKQGKLFSDKIKCLNELGMVWEVNRALVPFEYKIEVLEAYRLDKARGNGTIGFIGLSETYSYQCEVYPIGEWIKAFRKAYTGYGGYKKLTKQQERILENMGMVWDARKTRQARKTHEEKIYSQITKG